MSNPFQALDLSDDEAITVVKPVDAAKPAAAEKKHHLPSRHMAESAKPQKPRAELRKEEENLRQKKKHDGTRGSQPQPDVAHPGERSKIGLKKEPHVETHKQPQQRRGREFERHSGTGRSKEIKKGGGGGHNWGKAGEENSENPAPAATPDVENAPTAADEAPVVEEDPSLTLEEYEKLRAQKRVGEAFEIKEARKVTTQVTGKVYKKDEETGEGDYIKLGGEEHKKEKPGHFKSKAKQVFETNFKVRDSTQEAPPRRGGREGGREGGRDGGRGAPRGGPRGEGRGESRGEGRGEGRGMPRGDARGGRGRGAGAPGAAAGAGRIDTADQSAFPKLGA